MDTWVLHKSSIECENKSDLKIYTHEQNTDDIFNFEC